MWVDGVADSQTRSENRLFRPEFHLSFSQISQKPWGGWVGSHIWENFPQKNVFVVVDAFPYQFLATYQRVPQVILCSKHSRFLQLLQAGGVGQEAGGVLREREGAPLIVMQGVGEAG